MEHIRTKQEIEEEMDRLQEVLDEVEKRLGADGLSEEEVFDLRWVQNSLVISLGIPTEPTADPHPSGLHHPQHP
jgi:hypothetical protein